MTTPDTQQHTPTSAENKPASGVARTAYLVVGLLFLGIGIVGVALPGIPTTGPLLLALACFARSSKRLHGWLLNHRLFGPPIRHWQTHRIMPLRAKIVAVTMMAGSAAYVIFFSGLPTWSVLAVVGLVIVGMVFVLSIPHRIAKDTASAPRR